ncbi:MAG: hypothetical protein KDB23_15250 [Planctomycetales bacterium]|nr:hypothetical protein [Planctomycetales bacterium]
MGDLVVLTEEQVQRSFRALFRDAAVTEEAIEKAENLIDQLRLESPLRHRLSEEIEELRRICVANNN